MRQNTDSPKLVSAVLLSSKNACNLLWQLPTLNRRMVMNFDINALKHHQLVEDDLLEGCYLHQAARGSQPDDKAVLAERQALEKWGTR